MKLKELILFMKNVISNLNPLTCFISTYIRPKEFDSLNDMRSRELKNFLVQKINIDAKVVNQIFDRNELIQLALSSEKNHNINYLYRNEFSIIFCRLLLFIIFGYITYKCRHVINEILLDPFTSCYYRIVLKVGWMKKCIKKKFIIAFLAFLLSCLIDIYSPLIQLRILCSWITPSNSIIRTLMNRYVQILSLPVNPSLVMTNKNLSSFVNYGIDLGPVITLYLLKFTKHKLEDFACSILLKHQDEKRQRKEKDKEKHKLNVVFNSTNDLNFDDDNFKLD